MHSLFAALALLVVTETSTTTDNWSAHHRAVSTSSSAAQRAFDRGLVLAFAFNHDEAIRAFEEAAAADPKLAMAWWGVALANGPHINNPVMPPERSAAAWSAIEKARALQSSASPVERALIDALGARYAKNPPEDRAKLDRAYTVAMQKVAATYPKDADVAVLAAEAALDEHPWDTWTADGKPRAWTPQIVKLLNAAVAISPSHPGANHLLIHALEASPKPDDARAAADRLRMVTVANAPFGAGHLVHMPAHIDVRTGRWADAVVANASAMEVDRAYRSKNPQIGFYGVYMAHNPHFLAYAAMMDGQEQKARAGAKAMLDVLPPAFVDQNVELVDGYLAMPLEVLVRFGRWDEILKAPQPKPALIIGRGMWHHGRGVALAALGRVDEARAELTALRAEAKNVGERPFGNNKGKHVLAIADKVLEGEIELRAGNTAAGLRALEAAVVLEDELAYDEPPPWTLPVRHALGAALLTVNEPVKAAAVYEADLKRNRDNGWALTGLAHALRAQKKDEEAKAVDARVAQAFARADQAPTSSCLCLPAKATALGK